MNSFDTMFASNVAHRRVMRSDSSSSAIGLDIGDIVGNLIARPDSVAGSSRADPPSLEQRVFGALADAKIWTSRVAMHLERKARDRYFKQLDLLHDCDEWFGDEQPLVLESYKGFIRFMLSLNGGTKPSLALSPRGLLVAIWVNGKNRLTIEFSDADRVSWVLNRHGGHATERAAGDNSWTRMLDVVAPYDSGVWFNVA